MTRLTDNYASITPEKEETWMQEVKAMVKEFGQERTAAAVTAMIRNLNDFPTIGRLREYVPPVNFEVTAKQDCPDCHGTKWKPSAPGSSYVTRCHCVEVRPA